MNIITLLKREGYVVLVLSSGHSELSRGCESIECTEREFPLGPGGYLTISASSCCFSVSLISCASCQAGENTYAVPTMHQRTRLARSQLYTRQSQHDLNDEDAPEFCALRMLHPDHSPLGFTIATCSTSLRAVASLESNQDHRNHPGGDVFHTQVRLPAMGLSVPRDSLVSRFRLVFTQGMCKRFLHGMVVTCFVDAMGWANLLVAFVGCFLGTLVGVLPGLGPTASVALLFPFTAFLTSSQVLIGLEASIMAQCSEERSPRSF
jgi:hypothetical protein